MPKRFTGIRLLLAYIVINVIMILALITSMTSAHPWLAHVLPGLHLQAEILDGAGGQLQPVGIGNVGGGGDQPDGVAGLESVMGGSPPPTAPDRPHWRGIRRRRILQRDRQDVS